MIDGVSDVVQDTTAAGSRLIKLSTRREGVFLMVSVSKPNLLMYGIESRLLDLRRSFLCNHGYDVDIVSSSEEMNEELERGEQSYDLLFISKAVSINGRNAAMTIASQKRIPVYQTEAGVSPDDWIRDLPKLLEYRGRIS